MDVVDVWVGAMTEPYHVVRWEPTHKFSLVGTYGSHMEAVTFAKTLGTRLLDGVFRIGHAVPLGDESEFLLIVVGDLV